MFSPRCQGLEGGWSILFSGERERERNGGLAYVLRGFFFGLFFWDVKGGRGVYSAGWGGKRKGNKFRNRNVKIPSLLVA